MKHSLKNVVKNNIKVICLLKKMHFFKDVEIFFKIKSLFLKIIYIFTPKSKLLI